MLFVREPPEGTESTMLFVREPPEGTVGVTGLTNYKINYTNIQASWGLNTYEITWVLS